MYPVLCVWRVCVLQVGLAGQSVADDNGGVMALGPHNRELKGKGKDGRGRNSCGIAVAFWSHTTTREEGKGRNSDERGWPH